MLGMHVLYSISTCATQGRGCTGEFSRTKAKKSFGSTYARARKKEATQSHEEQFVPPPKMTISTFNNFAMLTLHPPGFSVRALRGKLGVSYLACASTQKVIPVTKNNQQR